MWFVYILECEDSTLYTGMTNNLQKRFSSHVQGAGARYTRSHPVHRCVYAEHCASRSDALKREAQIKKLSREEKLKFITMSG